MRIFILFLTLLALSTLAIAEEKFPGIKAMMSEDEFKAAGLHKMSPEELEALNNWLIRYTAVDAASVKNTVEEVKEEAKKEIVSTIPGEFNGWSGDTVFVLENGQVWKQRMSGNWKTTMQNPEVIIKRNLFGFYMMKVAGTKKKIGVKRVK